jgi:hypothetical protein
LVPLAELAQWVVQEDLQDATARRRVLQPQDDARQTAERLQEQQGVPPEDVRQVRKVELVLSPGGKVRQQVSPLPALEARRPVLSGPLGLLEEPEAPVQPVLQQG